MGEWISGLPNELEEAVWKRLVFCTLPEGDLVTEEAKELQEQDLNAIVNEGLARKKRRSEGVQTRHLDVAKFLNAIPSHFIQKSTKPAKLEERLNLNLT